jgi:preprotein translocase subunit SecE
MSLNREQKRMLQKQGELGPDGEPIRARRGTQQRAKERTGPVEFAREVRSELRKVAWPKWPEVRRFSIIVLVTVVIYTAYVGGLDALFGVFSTWLYD